MENSVSVVPETKCNACDNDVVEDDVFCASCGYPLKGTESEQKNFITRREFRDIDLAEAKKEIRKAGHALFYLSGIFALSGIISFVVNKDSPDVAAITIPTFILAILFLLLGEFSKKKPLACIISGISLYVIVQILYFIDNPANIVKGIIFKIVIIGLLIKGIKSAIEAEKIKKENNIA